MRVKKETVHIACGSFFIITGIILTIVLLALTANRKVGQKEVVVPYDEYKMKFYGEKEQGTYTTGVGVQWYTFQRNIRDLGLKKLECLSHDKVEIDLEVRVQILMDKDSLKRVVLKKFGKPDLHTSFLKYMAKCAIIATCLNFTAVQYYSQRSNIDKAMFENLQNSINYADFGATVEFFQLVTITLPEKLNEVIVEKQNIEQNLITAKNDRQNELIVAQTAYLSAQQTSQITLINANKTANIIRNKARQTEEIIKTEWDNRGIAYRSIVETLQLSEEEFLQYLNTELMRQVEKAIV